MRPSAVVKMMSDAKTMSDAPMPSPSEIAGNPAQSSVATPGETGPTESRAAKQIREIFASGRPLTYIRSAEEQRVRASCARWPCGSLRSRRPFGHGASPKACAAMAPSRARHRIAPRRPRFHRRAPRPPRIFHLKDFHEPLRESPEVRRRLRDVYESCLDQRQVRGDHARRCGSSRRRSSAA